MACCMLCVTITIAYCCLSSFIRSSMAPVATGSRVEAGPSISVRPQYGIPLDSYVPPES